MNIIDGHIHIFSEINGVNSRGPVTGCGYGKTRNSGVESPFTPPFGEKTSYDVELLLETMRQNGVSKAVLLQNPTIGSVNEEIGEAIRKYPEILTGVIQVDPFAKDAVGQAEALLARYPYRAIKFELSTGWGWTGIHAEEEFHYDLLVPLVKLAQEKDLVVVFDTGDTDSRAYLPEELQALAERFPAVNFVIEHGGYLTPDGDVEKWERMTDIGRLPNVYLGICAMGSLMEEEYPCQKGNRLLKHLYEKVGADKLFWGTDAPCTLKVYTYRQMIDSVARHADFLSEADLQKIFYDNADKLFFSQPV